MGRNRLLWLDVNSSYSHSSLALAAIEVQSERSDVEWEVINATISTNITTLTYQIVDRKPDIIACTAWLFTHEYIMAVLSRVKQLMPRVVIILGGPEFLGDNEEYLRRNTFIDAVLRGEGEHAFHRWLDVLHERDRWRDVEGLCLLSPKGYIDNAIAKIEDFAALKSPVNSRFFPKDKPFVQLETARGCFNSCAFCVSGRDKPIRVLSIGQVKKQIDEIISCGIKDIRVLDRTFNGNSLRTIELLDTFKEYSGLLRFHIEVHPALLSADIRERLKNMPKGVLHLEAGIQSLRQEVLDKCKRHGSLIDSLDGLRFLASLTNIDTHADLIAGIPMYTLDMIYEDIATLCEIGVSEIQLELLKLLPGTEMRQQASSLRLCYSPKPPYEILRSDVMEINDLREASLLSRLLDFYYNTSQWRGVFRSFVLEEKSFLVSFFRFMLDKDLLEQPLSMDKRGMLLYEYCEREYPRFTEQVSIAWIEAGLSLNKKPCSSLKSYKYTVPSSARVIYGMLTSATKLYVLKVDTKTYIYGYDREQCHSKPIYKGVF